MNSNVSSISAGNVNANGPGRTTSDRLARRCADRSRRPSLLTAPRSAARRRHGSPPRSARPRGSGGWLGPDRQPHQDVDALRRGDPVFVRHADIGAVGDRPIDPVGRRRTGVRREIDEPLRPDHDANPLTRTAPAGRAGRRLRSWARCSSRTRSMSPPLGFDDAGEDVGLADEVGDERDWPGPRRSRSAGRPAARVPCP